MKDTKKRNPAWFLLPYLVLISVAWAGVRIQGVVLNAGAITATGASTFSGGLSSSDSGTRSERLGSTASANGTDSTAVGYGAIADNTTTEDQLSAFGASSTASGDAATAVGYGATASGTQSSALGTSNTSSAVGSLSVGYSCTADGNYSIAMGYAANTGGFQGSVCVGTNATSTAAQQLVVGGTGIPVNDVYIGEGVTDASPPSTVTIQGTGGSGTDVAGPDTIIAGGKGTGAGSPGDVIIQTGTTLGTGATLQTLATRLTVNETSALFTVPSLSPVLVEQNTAGSGSPNILTSAESGSLFTNEGSSATNYHTLPTAAAGLWFDFASVDASDLMRITANTGDTITLNGSVSGSAGYIQSAAAGQYAFVRLVAVDATNWVALGVAGQWDVYDGAALNAANGLYAEYYITQANKAASAAITAGVPVEVGGTATSGPARGFTIATAGGGRATYDGATDKTFRVTVTICASSTKTGAYMLGYIADSGSVVAASEIRRELAATPGDIGAWAMSAIVTLSTDDYIEVYVDLEASASDTITAESMTVTISEVSN